MDKVHNFVFLHDVLCAWNNSLAMEASSLTELCLVAACAPWTNAGRLADARTGLVRAGREGEAEENARERKAMLTRMRLLTLPLRARVVSVGATSSPTPTLPPLLALSSMQPRTARLVSILITGRAASV